MNAIMFWIVPNQMQHADCISLSMGALLAGVFNLVKFGGHLVFLCGFFLKKKKNSRGILL